MEELFAAQAILPVATHLSVVWSSICVCHIRVPCLNSSTDLDAIWQVHLRGPMTHCVKLGSLTASGRRNLGLKPRPKHAIANCCCHVVYRRSDSACPQITLDLL